MSQQTTVLSLPYIMPSQAQKHVTHNEALRLLDAIVQLVLIATDATVPPLSPMEGDCYAVGAGATGIWINGGGKIAAYQDGTWTFIAPRTGWLARDLATDQIVSFDGNGWTKAGLTADELQNLGFVGVNTAADTTNRLAVSSGATLLTHEGAGHQLKINKNTPTDAASLLFQTGWSGRAEMGLTGGDDFSVKVSTDGAIWHQALLADRNDGRLAIQGLKSVPANYAPASSTIFTPGGDGTVSIYRIDTESQQNPRTATIASINGDLITLTAPVADTIFGKIMFNVVMARIWNTTRSADQHSAWVKQRVGTNAISVHDAAMLAGWVAGDTIQIGDPLSITPNRCITLDISPMLIRLFGQAFRQTGIMVRATLIGGSQGDRLAITPTGLSGSNVNGAVVSTTGAQAGDGVTIIPCTELSPISNSNLVRVQEALATTASIRLFSSIAVFK